MKNILNLLVLILVTGNTYAQENRHTQNYTEAFDSLFAKIDKSFAITGYIYDRVVPLADILALESNDTTSFSHFRQAYSELQRASFNKTYTENEWNYKHLTDYCKGNYYQNKIPIIAINTIVNFIDSNAFIDGRLKLDDDSIWSNEGNPYLSKSIVLASICNYKPFELNKEYALTYEPLLNIGAVSKIIITDNTEGKTYTLNNGSRTIALNFEKEGTHVFEIVVESDGINIGTFIELINVQNKTTTNDAEINYCSSIETRIIAEKNHLELNGKGDYKIFYGTDFITCDKILNKPIIVSDAWDPQDSRDYTKLIKRMDYYKPGFGLQNDSANLMQELRMMGYDIVVLNYPKYFSHIDSSYVYFYNWDNELIDSNLIETNIYNDGGTDYIERNGYVMVKLIQEINSLKVGNEPLIVIGPSMGGQISRYGLRYMEIQDSLGVPNMKHKTRLWVSFDSPHHGSNILPGIQDLLWYFSEKQGAEDAKAFLNKQLLRPGGLQMLIHSIDKDENLKNQYIKGGVHPMLTSWYNKIHMMGLPQTCRNIAIANGTYTGQVYHSAGSKMFDFKLKAKKSGTRLIKGDVFYVNTTNSNLVNLQVSFKKNYNSQTWSNTNYGSLDGAQGGMYNVQDEVSSSFENSSPNIPWPYGWGKFEINNKTFQSCFIPTVSALQLDYFPNNWTGVFNPQEKLCQGKIPFDNIYVSDYNMDHVTVDNKLANWIKQELQYGTQGCPIVCANKFNGTVEQLCIGQQITLSLDAPLSYGQKVVWSKSPGLQVIGNSISNTFTVKAIANNSNAWVKATIVSRFSPIGDRCSADKIIEFNFKTGIPNYQIVFNNSNLQCYTEASIEPYNTNAQIQYSYDCINYYSAAPTNTASLHVCNDAGITLCAKIVDGCNIPIYVQKVFPGDCSSNYCNFKTIEEHKKVI